MGESEPAAGPTVGKTVAKRWRAWLRAIHRDVGYLAVGFTFIYAISGIAINHIEDWDPNFKNVSEVHQIEPLGGEPSEEAATAHVATALGINAPPRDAYLAGGTQLELSYDGRTIRADLDTGTVYEERSEDRFFFRVANWLHYNRGKAAWTYMADAYAVLLLYLAISGLFMIKGRLGLKWRGTVIVTAGILIPVLYVHFSGGP